MYLAHCTKSKQILSTDNNKPILQQLIKYLKNQEYYMIFNNNVKILLIYFKKKTNIKIMLLNVILQNIMLISYYVHNDFKDVQNIINNSN